MWHCEPTIRLVALYIPPARRTARSALGIVSSDITFQRPARPPPTAHADASGEVLPYVRDERTAGRLATFGGRHDHLCIGMCASPRMTWMLLSPETSLWLNRTDSRPPSAGGPAEVTRGPRRSCWLRLAGCRPAWPNRMGRMAPPGDHAMDGCSGRRPEIRALSA